MSETRPYRHPLLWVPTSYFAMGTVWVMVTTVSAIMYRNLNLSNAEAAAYASMLGLAYTFKPLWAPLLEMFRTKKFFVISTQLVLAAIFALLAFALQLPGFLLPSLLLLGLCALVGATQDIASDGVYVTTLSPRDQAKFTGLQSTFWSVGPILVSGPFVQISGYLHDHRKLEWNTSWMIIVAMIGGLLLLLALYHSAVLPPGERAKDAPRDLGDAARTTLTAFRTFFQKERIWLMLSFAFFYRFGVGLLDKMGPLFLMDQRSNGGIGLSNVQLGNVIGTFGTGGFLLGSILGGLFVSRIGLRRVLLLLCLCINIPNLTFVYLSQATPEPSQGALIATVVTIEKFGYGFGAVGHMIYMMQQIAPGPYRTAHYAFATGVMGLCMSATGAVSGVIAQAVGYKIFFIIVMLAAIPSLLATYFAPFVHGDDARRPRGEVPEPEGSTG